MQRRRLVILLCVTLSAVCACAWNRDLTGSGILTNQADPAGTASFRILVTHHGL